MYEITDHTIGFYQVDRHLAHGGMADIYLAHDPESQKVVAIKLVHKSNHEYYERFCREIQEMISLLHPNILPVLDHGEDLSWCYLVMPYIKEGTLASLLVQGPLSLERAGHILAQLASALQYAHKRGILHRDIKPANVLIGADDHVYLADFGLVKHADEINGLTQSGYLIGTPDYMAPELADEPATIYSDIYALGVLCYQMVTGRLPFKAATPIAAFMKHISDEPTQPSLLNPGIPFAVEMVILRALDKVPQQRFHSADELMLAYAQALSSACEQQLQEDTIPDKMHISAAPVLLQRKVEMAGDENANRVLAEQPTGASVVQPYITMPHIQTRDWLARFVQHSEIATLIATMCILLSSGTFYMMSQENTHHVSAQATHAKTNSHKVLLASTPTATLVPSSSRPVATPVPSSSRPTVTPASPSSRPVAPPVPSSPKAAPAVSQPSQPVVAQNSVNSNNGNAGGVDHVKNKKKGK